MDFTKCRFCHERNSEYKCELNRFVGGVCHYAMQDTINSKFGREPTYCDSYDKAYLEVTIEICHCRKKRVVWKVRRITKGNVGKNIEII